LIDKLAAQFFHVHAGKERMAGVKFLQTPEYLLLESVPFALGGIDPFTFAAQDAQVSHRINGITDDFFFHVEKLVDCFDRQRKGFAFIEKSFREARQIAAMQRFKAAWQFALAAFVPLGPRIDHESAG
jgi:hypothetical protein